MTKANIANISNEDDLQYKTTPYGRLPQISKVKYLSNYWVDLFQILNLALWDQRKLYKCFKWRRPPMEEDLKWKTTSIIKRELSQQLLVGSSPHFKTRLMWPKQTLQMFQMKTTCNYWLDLPQILKLSLCDQSKPYKCFIWRWPQMEADLKCKTNSISKVKYLSNYLSDLLQLLNLGLCYQSKLYKCFKWRQPPMEDDHKWKTALNIKGEIA